MSTIAMPMTRGARKVALTTHVTSSVSWLGAVAAFLALAIAGVASKDAEIVRAAYVAMHLVTWLVIVPMSLPHLPAAWSSRSEPRGDCFATTGS